MSPACSALTVRRSLPIEQGAGVEAAHAGDQPDGADLAPRHRARGRCGWSCRTDLEADEQLGDLLGDMASWSPTSRPSASTSTRSAYDAATGSWLTITMVWPYSRAAVRSSPSTSRELRVSRLPVGSSARTTAGRGASARAIATRCCCPPDSSPGRCVTRSASPSTSRRWSTHARSSADSRRPASSKGSSTFSRTSRVGTRLKDWKTKPTWVRRRTVRARSSSACSGLAGDVHLTGGGVVEPGGDVHERRLAGAGRAHHGGEAAARHDDGHVVEGAHLAGAVAVDLADRVEGEEGVHALDARDARPLRTSAASGVSRHPCDVRQSSPCS